MKTKIFSKKLLVTLLVVLIAVMALFIAGCTNNVQDEPTTTEPVQTTGQSSAIVKGEGENAFVFIAVDLDGNSTHYMIKTDKETVGEALVENGLIAGDDGEYGLYVKTVNGITLDFDKDGKYWAFYEENTAFIVYTFGVFSRFDILWVQARVCSCHL